MHANIENGAIVTKVYAIADDVTHCYNHMEHFQANDEKSTNDK